MTKSALRLSAAMALAVLTASPAIAAKLRLPPARAPEAQIFAPTAIAADLQKRGYRIESMKRQGTAYSIKAVGPHKNKVQLMVDGRSGEIVGLAVLEPAPDLISLIAKAIVGGKNTRYIDDRYPFGIMVPDLYQKDWIVVTSWTVSPAAPRYIKAPASARGYRYAVPSRTVRPGRGGRSRSTIAPARMQKPQYDVYDAKGTAMETASAEDTTIISEVTTEETTYSVEESAMEASYLGGELSGESYDEVADYDAEDGDSEFADDSNDGYDAEVDEAEVAADLDNGTVDDADDTGDEASDDTDDADEADATDDAGDDSVAEDSAEEADEAADDADEAADDSEEAADDSDEGEAEEDEPEEEPEEEEDEGGDEDYDDGGDDGGDEPELATVS